LASSTCVGCEARSARSAVIADKDIGLVHIHSLGIVEPAAGVEYVLEQESVCLPRNANVSTDLRAYRSKAQYITCKTMLQHV